ncbi:MAG: phosphoribosylformylglycinamidine synthase subunit PurS [Phycisphaerales bacterium]
MPPTATAGSCRVHRFEVVPKTGLPDVIGNAVARDAAAIGVPAKTVRATHVYLVQAEPPLTAEQEKLVAGELLADPVTEAARVGASPATPGDRLVEVHPLPGVMDPVAQSVQLAIEDLLGRRVEVASGWRFEIAGVSEQQGKELAERLLANPVIQRATTEPYLPPHFPVGKAHDQQVRHITLTTLSDDALTKLSREAHLFLSLDEMKAVRDYYKAQGREPRDIELETLAQTWSEHCVHKTLKSTVEYSAKGETIDWSGRPGVTVSGGTVKINNLLKSTVAAATHELIAGGVDWALSVFKDNSGVVALDENYGVCIKVETHNRPSAIEPYGGAATGVGGCIRDVIGTGLGAKPIANTDVFCVAEPTDWLSDSGVEATVVIDELSGQAPVQATGTINGCRFYFRSRHDECTMGIALKEGLDPVDVNATIRGESWYCESPYTDNQASRTRGEDSAASYMRPEIAEKVIRYWGKLAVQSKFTDVRQLPPGCIEPRRVLTQVVAGVRDYGNRMGIPTVSGGVYFDNRYVGNPLVFCGCIGLIPRKFVKGAAKAGDKIVAVGGRTGATASTAQRSAALSLSKTRPMSSATQCRSATR